jgi:hypothetical protein
MLLASFRGLGLALGFLAGAAGILSSPAKAVPSVLFQDDFDANPPEFNVIPPGWALDGPGTIDFIGVCSGVSFYDFVPGNGCTIDMDGSSGQPGRLIKSLALVGDEDTR